MRTRKLFRWPADQRVRAALVGREFIHHRPRVRRWLVASTLAGGLIVAGVVPASALLALAAPSSPPATCADVHAADPTAPDGTYTLVNGGKGLTLYCFDMAGTPREYVTLVNTGTGTNFSQYTAGGASPGPTSGRRSANFGSIRRR